MSETKNLIPTPHEALENAVDIAGGQTALATKLNEYYQRHGHPQNLHRIGTPKKKIQKPTVIQQGHVYKWLKSKKGPSANHVRAIEALTGVSRYELRPDVFGTGNPPVDSSTCPLKDECDLETCSAQAS